MKNLVYGFFTLIILTTNSLVAGEKLDKIVISGPFASVSHPILHMIETNALADVADKIEFKLWKNPDELRAMAIKSDVDFIALPTNTAAILNNKGVDIKLLNVSVWGILGMISRDSTMKSLKDFKGKKIAVPFRADMPDIVFKQLLKKEGLDPKKDFELVYVASPVDAMQMLIMRRIDHALLAEPAISMALRKTKSFPVSIVAPDLYRSVDLQEEWGKIFGTNGDVPEAGIAVLGRMKNEHVIKRFQEEYAKSLSWYKANQKEAGKLVVKTLDMLNQEGVSDSISHARLKNITAVEAKKDLEFFFNILKEEDPKSIGDKLPKESFYYGL
ncbi:MAG: ABC transporter substrate-binding protein [Sulfurimonas sp. RIFCSPLOWO2_12_FULL_36_74]|uniref:ABC transporter substrate-binding protein n=1 Tax=Sulfurimonas sp. RIFCSPLOWO2_12_36_12 TaxID=1802253 RepID=UPI0008CF3D2C|nr:ABC transporter substrate-binding protein [Sulfurimonas sp. RIFCSPLOWO2_12_36_12]OHD98071.1 MAG: ABC transporter substrate-binding protein [Sulfurimonas sp. RIFCSPLOWO2_02_FULL_36_28]OHE02889.1 MAG: ABC transporter substrate-binding protein [Sulfurimonas sp. RIFCSPLOWO2_12_36_12]OHE07477.1 MAG: ABC transporter substrate-binding protein [Sulfurimonas sp. RIFCSPLOWO2_12_FULL_36_74]